MVHTQQFEASGIDEKHTCSLWLLLQSAGQQASLATSCFANPLHNFEQLGRPPDQTLCVSPIICCFLQVYLNSILP